MERLYVRVTCPHCNRTFALWASIEEYNSGQPVTVVCGGDERAGCSKYMAVKLSLTTSAEVFTLEPAGE